jgi:hypothetical protein
MNKQEQKQAEKEQKIIKSLFKDLIASAEQMKEIYLMPITLYTSICSKINYLERALIEARDSRDKWKNKYKELKR